MAPLPPRVETVTVALPGPPPFAMSVLDAGPMWAERTLLCLHGVGGYKEQWRGQVLHFARTCRIVAPDLRGHGHTPAAAGPCGVDQITEDLRQLVRARGLRTPLVVIAHCYGAVFALDLALRHPELVSHLVLIGIAPQLHYGPLLRLAVRAPVPLPLLEIARRAVLGRRFHATARTMRSFMREAILPWRGWDRLDEVRQPVLAIAGRLDRLARPPDVRLMAAQFPRGRLGIVRNVRHRIQLLEPVPTNRLIDGFLRAA